MAIAALAILLSVTSVHAQKARNVEQQLAAYVAAGEFGPALTLAQNAPPAVRDRLLAQVAGAQADAGARSAAVSTASYIDGDLTRANVLRDTGRAPIGATGRGGFAQPDFESLIELITTTVEPDTWRQGEGGAGEGKGDLHEFQGGVYVDAKGMLHRKLVEDNRNWLARVRHEASTGNATEVRRTSPLRKVSLTRLERLVQLQIAAGKPVDEAMQLLAGLQRVEYVLVYPDSGDVVLAGPAGDWTTDSEGRIVGVESGRPVLRLQDLVVLMRTYAQKPAARFGCSIDPRRDNLARTQAFLNESSKKPLDPALRKNWLEKIRASVGEQDVSVFDVDPQTRVAQVLVEADYRMKLVGIGLEPGVAGVESYLNKVKIGKGEAPPAIDVLRWWFTLNYDAVQTTRQHNAFAIRGQGVQVLSENELLEKLGKRVQTGKTDPINRDFASSFTANFDALAKKYHIFAELQNIFDLALASAIMQSEDVASQANWHQTCFLDPQQYVVPLGFAPKTVQSVINSRVIGSHTVAVVSGGVRFDPSKLVGRDAYQVDAKGHLGTQRASSAPLKTVQQDRNLWWWD